MLEHLVATTVPMGIHLLELMGVVVIVIGALKAFYKYGANLLFKKNHAIKIELAQALTLALEFKLGAEILKTVIIRNLDEMYILAAIIVLRAILAVVIHWEIKADEQHTEENKKKLSKPKEE